MRKYRLVMLLKSDTKKERRDKLFSDLKSWVGSEIKEDKTSELGDKKLSYPIKQQRNAVYYLMEFQSDTVATDFEKRIGMQEDVIRHLLVRDN